jgi:hypothetical protein
MVRELDSQFHALCKQKKQDYKQREMEEMLEEAYTDQTRFWRRLKGRAPSHDAGDMEAAITYWRSLFNKESAPAWGRIGNISDEDSHALNHDITGAEVEVAMAKLKLRTACGADGLPPELFKFEFKAGGPKVAPKVAECLAAAFNMMFKVGQVPEEWGEALLTLLHKSGDMDDWSNYRPIAVMQLMSKLYAQVLNARLSTWAESENLRAPSQAGFRRGYSTTMQMFILRHLVDLHRKKRRPLFTCFVDFRKAFDSVPRQILWQRLHDIGVKGRMLFAVQALYVNVSFGLKMAGLVSPPFPSNTGVRQGCPLSPFLFGVFIEMFDEQVRAKMPNVGPMLGWNEGSHCPLLFYADDVVLLSSNVDDLQKLLNELAEFCDNNGMQVNLQKTNVVVFRSGRKLWQLAHPLFYKGEPVKDVASYRYLGMVVHALHDWTWSAEQQVQNAHAKLFCMLQKYKSMEVEKQVWLQLLMFKVTVAPALLYGCEVWGSGMLEGMLERTSGKSRDKISLFRTNVLRHLLGARNSTARWALLRELGEYPLQRYLLTQAASFYSRCMAMPSNSLIRETMCFNRQLFTTAHASCWFGSLQSALQKAGAWITYISDGVEFLHSERIDAALRDKCHQVFSDVCLPAVATSDEVKLAVYHHWFACSIPDASDEEKEWEIAPYLRRCMPYKLVTKIARFRLGSHFLQVEKGRWGKVVRSGRFCKHVGCAGFGSVVDDERHAIFHCGAWQSLRSSPEFSELFAGEHSLRHMCIDKKLSPVLARFLEKSGIC